MEFRKSATVTTFTFPGQEKVVEKEKATIDMRPLTAGVIRSLMKQYSVDGVEYAKPDKKAGYQRFEFNKVDNESLWKAIWDYAIVGWKNVCVDNTSLECTVENKVLLIEGDPFFLDCVAQWRDELDSAAAKQAEAAEGN